MEKTGKITEVCKKFVFQPSPYNWVTQTLTKKIVFLSFVYRVEILQEENTQISTRLE